MGLIKDIVKAGAYGAIGGAVVKGVIKEAKKTPEERILESEERTRIGKSISFSEVLDIPLEEIKGVFNYIKENEFGNCELINSSKNILLYKCKISGYKIEIEIKLTQIKNKIVLGGVLTVKNWGCAASIADKKRFYSDMNAIVKNVETAFSSNK